MRILLAVVASCLSLAACAQPGPVATPAITAVTNGGTAGRLSYEIIGDAVPGRYNNPYSDDDSGPGTGVFHPANSFDADYLDFPAVSTERADAETTGATVRVSFTTNVPVLVCVVHDDALAANRPSWLTSNFTERSDTFDPMVDVPVGVVGSRYCSNLPMGGGATPIELGGNCETTCSGAQMYQVFLISTAHPPDFADPITPPNPVPGAVNFTEDSYEQNESTVVTFTVERVGGDDGPCTATIAEGTAAGSIVLNDTLFSWADQESDDMDGTVDLSAVGSDTDATLTLTAGGDCVTGAPSILDLSILNNEAVCGDNGCIRFGIDTVTVDEGATYTDKLRHMREQSNILTSLAASATVVVTSDTCDPSDYTFTPAASTWNAGEEGNRHVSLTVGDVDATCTITFGFTSLSNITLNSTLTTKVVTVNDTGGGPPPSVDCAVGTTNFIAATNGNAGNPGTLASPWTIAKANSTLTAGQTVCLRAGTYSQTIDPVFSGTANAKITYAAYNGETVNIAGASAGPAPVANLNTDYVVIDGLRLFNATPTTVGIQYQNVIEITGNHNEVINNVIDNPRSAFDSWKDGAWIFAISVRGTGNLIEGNTIDDVPWGVGVSGGGNPAATFAVIRGNTISDMFGDGITFDAPAGQTPIQGHLVEENEIYGSLNSDGIQSNGNPNTSLGPCGIVILNNIIHDNAENGVDPKGSCQWLIEGNVMYGNEGDNDGTLTPPWSGTAINDSGCFNGQIECQEDTSGGSTINVGSGSPSQNVIVRRNVVYDSAGGFKMMDTDWAIYHNTIINARRGPAGANTAGYPGIWSTGVGAAGRNNIIADNAIEIMSIGTSRWNYNLYSNCFQTPRFMWRGLPEIYTLAQWIADPWNEFPPPLRGGSEGDDNSFVAAPLLVSAPCGFTKDTPGLDFHLTASSPARNAAAPITNTVGAGSGTSITVADADGFTDGWGAITGDSIKVGSNSYVTVTDVNYSSNVLTVSSSISWGNGDPVYIGTFYGSAPDMGAYEYVE